MLEANSFEQSRRQCLRSSQTAALGNRFVPPWFDPLAWRFTSAGELQGELPEGLQTEGYRHLVHGGAIAALIDAAMTHCLFGHGVVALTAELKVQYRKPLYQQRPVQIHAFIEQIVGDQLYRLKSTIVQDRETRAEATGSFFRPLPGDPGSILVSGSP